MRPSRNTPARILVAAALLVAATEAWAQSTSSSLVGRVRTQSGDPVVDAVVQARSETTGMVRMTVTDDEGRYAFQLLPPGAWTVVARTAEGLISRTLNVTLGLQQSVRLDFALEAGATERVSVVARRPLIDPKRVGGELRVGGATADSLPIAGRVATDLALMDSSVQTAAAGNFFGERGAVFVVNGQSGRSNSFLVDGLDNNDQTSGTTLNAFFSQQVIREFVVLTHQYAPEFGRATGGVLNIVTERGSNEPVFEAFVQGTRAGWNDPGSFVSSLPGRPGVRDTVSRGQAGFKLGGPFKKDRAFYFLAYERQQADDVVPYTGVDRQLTPGGWTVAPSRSDNLFFRTDLNLDSNNHLMVRLSGDDRTTRGVNVGGIVTPEAGFRVQEQDAQLAAAWTTVASADLMNEVRLLAGTSSFDQFANSVRTGVTRPSGIYGGNILNRQLRDEDRIQLVDNVTWRLGSHTLKAGLDVTRSSTRIRTRFNPNGTLLYDTDDPFEPGDQTFGSTADLNSTCVFANSDSIVPCPGAPGVDDDGDGLVDEDAVRSTYPLVFTVVEGEPSATLEDTRYGLFVQDSWEAGPRLMLDYGLRYDLSTFTLPGTARVTSTIPNGGAGRDWNNFAPRIGFTFLPKKDGKVVLRGGAGVFYDKLVLAFPGVAAVTSQTAIKLIPARAFGWEINEDLVANDGVESLEGLFGVVNLEPFILRFSTGTRLETPYAVQFNLGMERAALGSGAWRVNVVRSRAYHQPVMRDLNPVAEFVQATDSALESRFPLHRDTGTGSIAAVVTEGRAWHTGVELGWRWQGEAGWYSASYTWSKTEDLGPDPLKGGVYLPPSSFAGVDPADVTNAGRSNSDDLATERGRADHDRRHRLALAGESPPLWMGIKASAVIQVASGAPFNVTTGRDENLDGVTTDRPVGVGRNTGADTPLGPVNEIRAAESEERRRLCEAGQERWCGLPDLPAVGSLTEPSFVQVDLRVWKPLVFGRSGRTGEFFVQVFNLFNRFNGGPVEGRVIARDFGRPVGRVGPPRTVEAGLRLRF